MDEATNGPKPPMIGLLLELRRIETGQHTSAQPSPTGRGLVAVAYPAGGLRIW